MQSGLRMFVSRSKAPLSVSLVLLLLFLQTLAASPLLHGDIHHDAASSDHTCVVTTLSQGQVDLTDSVSTIELPPRISADAQPNSAPFLNSLFFSVDSNRGPPASA
jgi:hypothetical protein